MSYKHITFDESEVWKNLEKIEKKSQLISGVAVSAQGKSNEQLRESINLMLDIAGFIPIYGDLIDIARAIFALGQAAFESGEERTNKLVESLFLLLSAAPIFGDFVGKGGLAAFKAYRAGNKSMNILSSLIDFLKKVDMQKLNRGINIITKILNNAPFYKGFVTGFVEKFDEIMNSCDDAREEMILELEYDKKQVRCLK
jgi:hypothetical protein